MGTINSSDRIIIIIIIMIIIIIIITTIIINLEAYVPSDVAASVLIECTYNGPFILGYRRAVHNTLR
jgi:hypothetical protein